MVSYGEAREEGGIYLKPETELRIEIAADRSF